MNSRYSYAYHDPRFPETDDVPLESEWHRQQINFLIELLDSHFHGREDFYVSGNMFIYYDPDDPEKNAGPDVFYVKGMNRWPERAIWAVWEEGGRFPDFIVELMSPKTKNKGGKTNKDLYEQVFHTPEYFFYDPDTQVLEGWRLTEGVYRPIQSNPAGRLWSEQLALWLGVCESSYYPGRKDTWVRLFETDGRQVPTYYEREHERAEEARRQADEAQQRREENRRRIEEARRRTEETWKLTEEHNRRAEEARRRADAAEAELARLRALLQQSDNGGKSGKNDG